MVAGELTADERVAIETIARYQFRLEPAEPFLPHGELEVHRSRSGRVDRIYHDGERLCTLTTHGRLTLGIAGGRQLYRLADFPMNRVIIGEEAVPFVADGRNAFAKFVLGVDDDIRPRDEVVVVNGDDRLIAVGRAELSAEGMLAFERGMAVSIRHPIDSGATH